MEAFKEINRLREQMLDGDLDPHEPIFVLRARDVVAADVVVEWVRRAELIRTPIRKLMEAVAVGCAMREWPIKQTPGLPGTRTDNRAKGVERGPRDPVPPQG